jgi:hypothetical protein
MEGIKKRDTSCVPLFVGAEGGTRTPMPLRAQRPERCVSTNFTTSAGSVQDGYIILRYASFVKRSLTHNKRPASAKQRGPLVLTLSYYFKLSAEGGTRTPMPLRAQRPERCVSTNFTTSAGSVQDGHIIAHFPLVVNSFSALNVGGMAVRLYELNFSIYVRYNSRSLLSVLQGELRIEDM